MHDYPTSHFSNMLKRSVKYETTSSSATILSQPVLYNKASQLDEEKKKTFNFLKYQQTTLNHQ